MSALGETAGESLGVLEEAEELVSLRVARRGGLVVVRRGPARWLGAEAHGNEASAGARGRRPAPSIEPDTSTRK